jgi:hypothetical protein
MIHLTYDGSCPCSLDLRRERQRGVAMGTVGRGLLWFDADRTPASGIPAPEATREIRSARVQQERYRATAPQSLTSDPAHRGATT